MNERIRELRASAFAYATVSSTDYFEDKKDFNEKFDEKFAELIVRECLKITEGLDQTTAEIKEHFGVEE